MVKRAMSIPKIALVALLPVVMLGAFTVAQARKNRVEPMSSAMKSKTKCEVHKTKLQTENVKIAYGLMGFMPGFLEAQRRTFPNANSVVMGGCVISDDSPKLQTVKFCPSCRVAQKKWSAARKSAG